MKRAIRVCCPAMLRAINKQDVVVTEETGQTEPPAFHVTIRERSGNRLKYCPYCSDELPFRYLEE